MMNNTTFCEFERYLAPLHIDLTAAEFYEIVENNNLDLRQLEAIKLLINHLGEKKIQATIDMYLRTSRLPLKEPKTFDNFDFSVIKGKDADIPIAPPLYS